MEGQIGQADDQHRGLHLAAQRIQRHQTHRHADQRAEREQGLADEGACCAARRARTARWPARRRRLSAGHRWQEGDHVEDVTATNSSRVPPPAASRQRRLLPTRLACPAAMP